MKLLPDPEQIPAFLPAPFRDSSSSQVFWSLKPSKLSFFDVETEKNIGYPEKYQKQENETLLHAEQLLHLQGA